MRKRFKRILMGKRPTYRSTQRQFEQYFQKELTSSEEHSLEKKALEDSFEFQAMEGWEAHSPKDLTQDLNHLRKRLSEQVVQKKRKILPYWQIAAAIAVLLISSFSLWSLVQSPSSTDTLAMNEEKEATSPPSPPVSEKQIEVLESKEVAIDEAKNKEIEAQEAQRKAEINRNQSRQRTIATSPPPEPKKAPTPEPVKEDDLVVFTAPITEEETGLFEEEEESGFFNAEPTIENESYSSVGATTRGTVEFTSGNLSSTPTNANQVSGRVTDVIRGDALLAISVELQGTDLQTTTDFDGYYQLEIPDSLDSPVLVFSANGYETTTVEVTNESQINIVLKEEAVSFPVVALQSQPASRSSIRNREATPVRGYDEYERYLNDNLKVPEQALQRGTKGKVVLHVTIENSGDIGAIKVQRSIGDGCDEEAIRLVKEGPSWQPALVDGETQQSEVKVKIKFP